MLMRGLADESEAFVMIVKKRRKRRNRRAKEKKSNDGLANSSASRICLL
jgi:hypothetical protein